MGSTPGTVVSAIRKKFSDHFFRRWILAKVRLQYFHLFQIVLKITPFFGFRCRRRVDRIAKKILSEFILSGKIADSFEPAYHVINAAANVARKASARIAIAFFLNTE
ncbi:MAG: hypothetical protein FWC64_02690 [Treponema sp.]|nr:hypothetical protein [Treponema sp.]